MEQVFIIKNIDNEKKEVHLEDEEKIIIKWPLDKIINDLKIGDKIYFNISDKKQKGAKEILNEILKIDE
ncbi:hypothetical protein K8R62_01000 [bacterium]|nr:hypothetical protein [bacterium]